VNDTQVILANLSNEEFDRFRRAGVPYTCSSGPLALDPEGYAGVGPYIATVVSELGRAMEAIGWQNPNAERQQNQWIIRNGDNTNQMPNKFLSADAAVAEMMGILSQYAKIPTRFNRNYDSLPQPVLEVGDVFTIAGEFRVNPPARRKELPPPVIAPSRAYFED
jgi:hypothetical protein